MLLFKYKQTLEKLILLNHQIPLKINRVLDGDHHRCERHTPRGLHPCWEVLEETLGFVLRIRTIPIKTNNYDCAELSLLQQVGTNFTTLDIPHHVVTGIGAPLLPLDLLSPASKLTAVHYRSVS